MVEEAYESLKFLASTEKTSWAGKAYISKGARSAMKTISEISKEAQEVWERAGEFYRATGEVDEKAMAEIKALGEHAEKLWEKYGDEIESAGLSKQLREARNYLQRNEETKRD